MPPTSAGVARVAVPPGRLEAWRGQPKAGWLAGRRAAGAGQATTCRAAHGAAGLAGPGPGPRRRWSSPSRSLTATAADHEEGFDVGAQEEDGDNGDDEVHAGRVVCLAVLPLTPPRPPLVGDVLRAELRAELRAVLRAELRAELRDVLRAVLRDELRAVLRDELRDVLRAELRDVLRAVLAATPERLDPGHVTEEQRRGSDDGGHGRVPLRVAVARAAARAHARLPCRAALVRDADAAAAAAAAQRHPGGVRLRLHGRLWRRPQRQRVGLLHRDAGQRRAPARALPVPGAAAPGAAPAAAAPARRGRLLRHGLRAAAQPVLRLPGRVLPRAAGLLPRDRQDGAAPAPLPAGGGHAAVAQPAPAAPALAAHAAGAAAATSPAAAAAVAPAAAARGGQVRAAAAATTTTTSAAVPPAQPPGGAAATAAAATAGGRGDQHQRAGAAHLGRAQALLHPAGHLRAAHPVPVPGHAERPAAQPQALVQAQVGPGDVPPHVEVAAGARVPADVVAAARGRADPAARRLQAEAGPAPPRAAHAARPAGQAGRPEAAPPLRRPAEVLLKCAPPPHTGVSWTLPRAAPRVM